MGADLVIAAIKKLPPPPPLSPSQETSSDATSASVAATLLRTLLSHSAEERLTTCGQAAVLTCLIGRLASQQEAGSELQRLILNRALPTCKDGAPLLISWLHEEIAKEEQSTLNVGHYSRSILRILLSSLREAVPANGCAVTQSLLDVPCLPEELLLEALNCAVASPEYRLGLATARDLAMRRDAASRLLAWLVELRGFEAQSKLLRREATRVVASSLFAVPHLNERIHKHSTKELYAALRAEDVPGDKEFTKLVVRMQLHLALCASHPSLLADWFGGYARATSYVRSLMCTMLGGIVPHMRTEDREALFNHAISKATAATTSADSSGTVAAPTLPVQPLVAAVLEAAVASDVRVPPQLISRIVVICRDRLRDPTLTIPLLPYLDAPQAESLLPLLLAAPPATARAALTKLVHAKPPPLPPTRLLLALHLLPAGGVSVKQLINAIGACISERSIFTLDTMADCLKLIVQQDPLPLLSMRTTIEALVLWPELAPFVMGLLRHLINRQIWESKQMWTGFVKCCLRPEALRHSLPVILSLPRQQLKEVIGQQEGLREQLTSFAAMNMAEVPQDALDTLDLADEEAEAL